MNNPLDITWKFLTKNLLPILQISFVLGIGYYLIDKLLGLLYPHLLNFNFFYQQFTSLLTVPIQLDTIRYDWQFWVAIAITLLVVSLLLTIMLKMVSIFINIASVSAKDPTFKWSFTFRTFLYFVARLVKQPHKVLTSTSSSNETTEVATAPGNKLASDSHTLELTTSQRLAKFCSSWFLMLLTTLYISVSTVVLSMPFYGYLQHIVTGSLSISIILTVIVWIFVITFNLSFLLPAIALVMYGKHKRIIKYLSTSFIIFREFWYNTWVFTILMLCYVILAQLAGHYIQLVADQIRLGLLGDLLLYTLYVVKYFAIVAFALGVCMTYMIHSGQTREQRDDMFVDRPYVPARRMLQNIFSSMINALQKNNSYKPEAKTNKLTHYQIINSDQSNLALNAWREDQEYFSDNDAAHNSSPLAEPHAHHHTAAAPVTSSLTPKTSSTSKSTTTPAQPATSIGTTSQHTPTANSGSNPSLALDGSVPEVAPDIPSKPSTSASQPVALVKTKAALDSAGHLVSNLTKKTAGTGKQLGKLCSKLFGRNKKVNNDFEVVGDNIQFKSDAIPETAGFDTQNDVATASNSSNTSATPTPVTTPKDTHTSSTTPKENLDPTNAFSAVRQSMQQQPATPQDTASTKVTGTPTHATQHEEQSVTATAPETLEADVVPIPAFDATTKTYMGNKKS